MRKTFTKLSVVLVVTVMIFSIFFISCKNETAEIKSISVEEVYEIIKNKEDYLIIDVRTKEEYDEGHIGGATLLPVQELEDRLNELPKDKPIIVYCRSGNRSRTAAGILVNNGFTQVYDMGGIGDWIAKDYPVEK